MKNNIIQKRFPANTTLQESTFLNNKKINGELYALLISYSYPDAERRTVVKKGDLPTQAAMCEKLGFKSPKTYRAHVAYLLETGYLFLENDKYYFPKKEDIFFDIPLETVQYLNDTAKELVIKIYIYLGQRYKYKPNYIFTIQEIAEHLGIALQNNKRNYDMINNALISLKNNGLIDYVAFYDGKRYCHRIENFSFHVKNQGG